MTLNKNKKKNKQTKSHKNRGIIENNSQSHVEQARGKKIEIPKVLFIIFKAKLSRFF